MVDQPEISNAVALGDGRVVRLRPGRPEDGEVLLALHHASILRLGRGFYAQDELDDWASGLRPEGYAETMAGGETFLVAEAADGALAGFTSYKADEIVGFYVHPDWVRCGVGSVMLQHAEAAIAAAGHKVIRVDASLSGLPFYRVRGYRVIRRKPYKTRGGMMVEIADLRKDV